MLLDAVNASSAAGVLAVWDEAGVMMPPHRPAVIGREALDEYFRALFARVRLHFAFTDRHLELHGDVALERLAYSADARPLAGGPVVADRGKGLHVWRRQGSEWKLAQDIWNSDLPSPS